MEIEGYFTSTAFLSTSSPTHDPYLTTLNDGQESLMSILGLISAGLSVIGSSLIVLRVLRKFSCQCCQRREESMTAPVATPVTVTPYDRLMLGLSTTDIISSITFGIGPFLLPADSSPRAWAAGTDATCSTLGFFTQLSFLSVAYNGILSVYYLLTVRMGVKRADFAKRYEPWLHGLVIFYFVTTASIGLGIGLYSELLITQGCWIGEYPENCTATGTCISTMIGWIYAGIPFLVVFLGLPIINLSIYRFVRNQFGENGNRVGVEGVPMVSTTPREEAQKLRVREVAQQGFLYVAFFYVAYTPAFLVRVFEGMGMKGEEEENIYWLLVLNSMLLPLQGWFNFFIYMRPNYTRVRKAYPEKSRWWALQLCILEQDLPTLLESRDLYSADQQLPSSNNKRSNQSQSHGANDSATKSIDILDSIQEGDNESTSRHSRGNVDYNTSTSEDDDEYDREGGLFASTRTDGAKSTHHIQMDGSIRQSPTKPSSRPSPFKTRASKMPDITASPPRQSLGHGCGSERHKKSHSEQRTKVDPTKNVAPPKNSDGSRAAVEATSPAPAALSRKKSQVLRPKRQPKAVPILDQSSWAQLDTVEAGHGAGGKMDDEEEAFADPQGTEEILLRTTIQRRKLAAQEQLEKNRLRAAQSRKK